MSLAQIKHVKRAQKDQDKCAGCGKALPAGSEYRYYKPGFRSRTKIRLCMSESCTPRRSQLESSKLSEAYAAIETAEDRLNDTGTPDEPVVLTVEDVQEIIDECASEIRRISEEYEASIEAAPMLEDTIREKIEQLDQFADELESLSLDDEPEKPERDEFDDDEEFAEALDEYQSELEEARDTAREAARDALSGAEF